MRRGANAERFAFANQPAGVRQTERYRLARLFQREPKIKAVSRRQMGDSAAGEGGNQLFMLLTLVAPGFRQRGHKGVVVKAGDDQILQQMADPLATGIKPQSQRRRRVSVAGDDGQTQIWSQGF